MAFKSITTIGLLLMAFANSGFTQEQKSSQSLENQAKMMRAESSALWQDAWELKKQLRSFREYVGDPVEGPFALDRKIREYESYLRDHEDHSSSLTTFIIDFMAYRNGKLPDTRLKEIRTELEILKDIQSGGQKLIQMNTRMEKMFQEAVSADQTADSLERLAKSRRSVSGH